MGHQVKAGLRILVVDDHADSAEVIGRMVTRFTHGYTVITTTSFEDGLAAARKDRFDLLLSDIGLADRDGCELLREIRAIYPIPAIAVTAFAMPSELQRDREAGFDDCLVKPFTLDELLTAIQRATSIPRVSDVSPPSDLGPHPT